MHTTAFPTLLASVLPRDVPVQPDADQARSWLQAELLDSIYHEVPSLADRILAWVEEQLDRLSEAASAINPLQASLVVLGIVAVIVAVALLVAGPVRRARRVGRVSNDALADDTRSAAELRSAAATHAAAGRLDEALLDQFRAILRSLEERAVLAPRPGRTADEGAAEAGQRFAEHARALADAGRLFDDVCYGEAKADEPAYRWISDLDQTIASTRPTLPDATAHTTDALVVAR